MLFDLIKCHTRLFSLQRDRDADGGVIAREEDFVAAAKLFSALSGTAGSQEMKLTKNEAAAIATVARMGIDMFTIRELQSALGLSYHQTYRLLHGYTNNRTTYAGILEKCPAVSYIDTTVTANDDGGTTVRRREHYFSFDLAAYRAWSAQATVWLDDEPDGSGGPGSSGGPGGSDDVYTLTPRLHSNSGESVNENAGRNGDDSPIGDICTDICTEESTHLHCLPKTRIAHPGASDPSPRACEIRAGANIPTIREDVPPIRERPAAESLLKCKVECKGVQTSVKVQTSARINPRNYVALPAEKDEPCHVCGRRPTSSVLRSGGKYLCYDCLKRAKRPARCEPLPGVLDPGAFERTKVELGRCTVCNRGRAVYRSPEAKICEVCYTRLVREENTRAGVR